MPRAHAHCAYDLSGIYFKVMATLTTTPSVPMYPRKAFQVDVLLLTRRPLSPTHRTYDTGLVESDKMSEWGWRSADSVMYRKKVRRVNEALSLLRRNVHWQCTVSCDTPAFHQSRADLDTT
jgi:DNA-binding transcriptional ArsR family regulator